MTDSTHTPQPARLLDCGLCFEEQGEEVHPHPECPIATVARYHRRADEVQAVQWTGSNVDELRAFAGPHFDTIDPEDRIEDGDQDAQVLIEASYWTGISPGYWVLKFEDHLDVERDENFRAAWAPAAVPAVSAAVPPTTHTADQAAVEPLTEADRGEEDGVREWADYMRGWNNCRAEVLAAPPADPRAILRKAAEQILAADLGPRPGHSEDYGNGWSDSTLRAQSYLRMLADDPSRLADEAQQQPETQDRSAGCCGRPPGAICVHDHPAAASVGVQTDEEEADRG